MTTPRKGRETIRRPRLPWFRKGRLRTSLGSTDWTRLNDSRIRLVSVTLIKRFDIEIARRPSLGRLASRGNASPDPVDLHVGKSVT
jgi:hypothetical protein